MGSSASARHRNSASGRPSSAVRSAYKEPDEVADAVEKALFKPNPKLHYMVVPNQQEAGITIKMQMEQLVQLNEDQPYAYDRDALVKILEEETIGSRRMCASGR